MSEPLPCFRCKKAPSVDTSSGYPTIACYDCYDGAPDSSRRNECASGVNLSDATAMWNEKMNEYADDEEELCK